jgi:hypothetical protein
MASTVPAPAAAWIVAYLRNQGGAVSDWKERDLAAGSGLNGLIGTTRAFFPFVTLSDLINSQYALVSLFLYTVKQLKSIWNAVEPYTDVRRPANSAKKAIWVDSVRRVFYVDQACRRPNVDILSQLPTGQRGAAAAPAPVRISHSAQSRAAAISAIAAAVSSTQQQQPQPGGATARRGPQSLARRPQNTAQARPQTTAAARQGSPARQRNRQSSPQARRRAAAAAAAPPAANRQAQNAAANRQAQNMAIQQAALSAALSSFGGGPGSFQVHAPPYPYNLDWMQQPAASSSFQFIVPPAAYAPAAPSMPPPPSAASVPAQSSSTTTTGPSANKRVKQEPGSTAAAARPPQVAAAPVVDESYWETRPKNAQESSMVAQLQQMGFTDMREMLTGIRHVLTTPTDMESQLVERAMMWIVSQREEMEEARKLDAARARSEALRAEQARLRKQAAHERLWGSTMDDWASQADLFCGSIVLKEARECLETHIFNDTERKAKLIRFLELEKKARKWYGTSVPWCFLCSLCERWKELSAEELAKSIEQEASALETAMYSLSQQQGGVPIIFSEARSIAEKNGRPVSPGKEAASADDSDDDDVIVVKEVSASESDSRLNSESSNGNNKYEVIELL